MAGKGYDGKAMEPERTSVYCAACGNFVGPYMHKCPPKRGGVWRLAVRLKSKHTGV